MYDPAASFRERASALKALAVQLWPVAAGLAILYVPTFAGLMSEFWSADENAHAPIILALSLWLLWRQWPKMLAVAGQGRSSLTSWGIFAAGLLLYTIGRSQDILVFEIGSFIVVLASLMLLILGPASLKTQWFPFVFMVFMLPIPGDIVGMVTMPIKIAVSWVVEHVLFWLGYPISRNGVILQVGQYQLMVADACAGLQTFLTLEALGLFYLNVVRSTSAFRNTIIAVLIVPISFTANVIRVIALTLITYYFGDAAGQGFLHGFAGLVLFMTALLLITSLDAVLQRMYLRRQKIRETMLLA